MCCCHIQHLQLLFLVDNQGLRVRSINLIANSGFFSNSHATSIALPYLLDGFAPSRKGEPLAALHNNAVYSLALPLPIKYNKAIRTATPLVTCAWIRLN